MSEPKLLSVSSFSDEDIVQKVRIKRKHLSNDGQRRPGISPDIDPDKPPVWFEKETFEHAQKLYKTYSFIINITAFLGLILSLNFEKILDILLSTGKSSSIDNIFERYLFTEMHMDLWFRSDPFDPESKAYRSLRTVRQMHRSAAEKCDKDNKDYNNNNNDDQCTDNLVNSSNKILAINQCQMAHTQFAFIGLCTIFPKQMGFHLWTSKDFRALFHFWRVIGYCLGIEDRFNLFSGSNEEIIEYCRQLFYEEWLPLIKKFNHRNQMNRAIVRSLHRYTSTFNSLMRYSSEFMGFDPKLYRLETLRDKHDYLFLKLVLNVYTRSKWINFLLSQYNYHNLKKGLKCKDPHIKRLQKKYPNEKFYDTLICLGENEEKCPFSNHNDNNNNNNVSI